MEEERCRIIINLVITTYLQNQYLSNLRLGYSGILYWLIEV